jgi:hypothetical protein
MQITTQLSEAFLDERPGWTENYLRKLAAKWLEAARADESMAFEANTIAAELVANTVKYGRAASELAVAHTPLADGIPETVDIVAVNPVRGETATPGTAHRGELASDEPNDESEHGRGLMMTNAYTQGNWGQQNFVSPNGKHEVITFAVLSSDLAPDDSSSLYKDAA